MDDEEANAFHHWLSKGKSYSDLTCELYIGMVRNLLRHGATPRNPAAAQGVVHTFSASSLDNRERAWNLYLKWKSHPPLPARRRPRNRVEINDDGTARLWLTNRKKQEIASFVVEQDDLSKIERFRWSISWRGKADRRRPYIITQACTVGGRPRKVLLLHRLLMDAPKGMEVDHINGDAFDNTRKNLRLVTKAQQMQNVATHNPTGYRNVYKSGSMWSAVVTTNGTSYWGGTFSDIEAAAQAATELRAQVFTHHNEKRSKHGRPVAYEGKTYSSLAQLVQERAVEGVSATTVRQRCERGWSLDLALRTPCLRSGRPRDFQEG